MMAAYPQVDKSHERVFMKFWDLQIVKAVIVLLEIYNGRPLNIQYVAERASDSPGIS